MAKKDFWRRFAWGSLAFLFVMTGVVFSVVLVWQSAHQKDNNQNQQQSNSLNGTKLPNYKPVPKIDKLQFSDIKVGSGKTVKASSTVSVHYVGALASTGVIFDNSLDSGQALTTKLSDVIPGWQALTGMKVGGERQLLIPASLAYGSRGSPPTIPPNSDLVFDVVLIDVK